MPAADSARHRLEVEDFGPIARADLQLRPLTVFFGPSGAGKSYLAKLIYALHGYFAGQLAFKWNRWRVTEFYSRTRKTPNLPDLLDRLESYLGRQVPNDDDVADDEDARLEADLAPLARAAVGMLDVAPVLAHEIRRIYGAETLLELIRKPGSTARFTLSYRVPGDQGREPPFRYGFTIDGRKLNLKLEIRDDAPIRLERRSSYWSYWLRAREPGFFYPPSRAVREEPMSFMRLQAVLASLAQPSTVGAISRSAYYLPASRSGLVEGHGALVESSLERLTRGNRRRQQGTLSGVLVDFIRQTFIDPSSNSSEWDGGESLARHVEQTIVGGTVRVDELENGSSCVAYRPNGWQEDLPLTRVSSMVAEAVPLVLYLRQYVTPGSTIIIEEPEAHMHPAMQIRMAAAIVAIVNAGVRVVITTHSEWFLSALANIVRSARLPESDQEDIAGHSIALPASEIGVWRFAPDTNGGSVTQAFPLDSEDGMYNAGYPEVGRELYNAWATIVSRLQED